VTRASRLAFGFVLMVGTGVLVDAVVGDGHPRVNWHEAFSFPLHAWQLICGTWLVAALAALAGKLIPDRGDRFRVASYVVPSMGVALLLPLTLHMPIALYVGDARSFDEWCMYSVFFVGAAHLAFALMAGARAKAIVEGREPLSVHTLYGVTVAMACVPGLLVVLPVLIVAATGIPILPLLYLMERWGRHARFEGEMPTAVARIAS
jgi:hypothetical protein